MNATVLKRFQAKIDVRGSDACWLWTGASSNAGYGRFKIDGKLYSPHRLAYELAHGSIGKGLMVCHRCCNPAHLFVGTRSDNMKDAHRKGRLGNCKLNSDNGFQPGSKHPDSVLTEAVVLEMRSLYASGEWAQKDLGAKYGVSKQQVSRIVRREGWTHV